MIIGQILITQPLLWLSGVQPWAFTVVGVFFAAAASSAPTRWLGACYRPGTRHCRGVARDLSRLPRVRQPRTWRLPALARFHLSRATGMTAVRHLPVLNVGAACVAGGRHFPFSIRQFAVAAPASVMFAAICVQEARRARHWVLAACVAACCLGIHIWRSSLPGQLGPIRCRLRVHRWGDPRLDDGCVRGVAGCTRWSYQVASLSEATRSPSGARTRGGSRGFACCDGLETGQCPRS